MLPSSANAPLGWGKPPAGSVVTAAAWSSGQSFGSGTSISKKPLVLVLNTVALIGLPDFGTNHS